MLFLDEAHTLTERSASNALLKKTPLEEPPDRVIFVMATDTQPEDLADTIRITPCSIFNSLSGTDFRGNYGAAGRDLLKKENLTIEPGALAVIARMAEGSLRDALSPLLEQAQVAVYCGDVIPDKEVRELLGVVPEDSLNELVAAIAEGSADRALGLVQHFSEGRPQILQHFCREAIRAMRNL